MNNSQNKNLLTEGSIWKKLMGFAFPLFLGNLFQQLYNTADSLIVGNFLGSDALAAVSSSGSLTFLLVGFFQGLAMGAGVIIARYFGARQKKELHRAIHTTVAFGILCGILLTAGGVVLAPKILILMKTPADILPKSTLYFQVYAMGSLGLVLYNNFVGIMQAVGDSRHPLYYLIFFITFECGSGHGFCRWIWNGCGGRSSCHYHFPVYERIFVSVPSDEKKPGGVYGFP